MLNIAIDGVSGAGKSTIAEAIAKTLNIKKFDTGAIYRGFACEYLSQNLPNPTNEIMDKFVQSSSVEIFFEDTKQHVVINGKDYTNSLREEKISYYSSIISPFPVLREKVLDLQRKFARENDCVMEGRDIGSIVLPNANVKFYLTASVNVRAQRRLKQLQESGMAGDYEEILNKLKDRDYNDLTRKIAPLKKMPDAIEIDGSELTIEQVVEKCLNIIRLKIEKR